MSVFHRRPEAALDTKHADARITDGLTCKVTEGDREVVIDMPEPVGGCELGPSPGFHARAAVSGCVAIGIKMTAVRLGIELRSVHVGVDMDFDDSAIFGMGDASAAPLRTRLKITLASDADRETLQGLVDTALEADPYFLALRDPQTVETVLDVA
ncbi:OsmC family protein [Ovoidimarina sediminis]|uniref:OsmC family protein n=1 Tax=Ovoidimarina sediminis TaxID=3079856 RepID=UPI00291145D4|nr:OsmC family protein [Rhodophyticola sp. MJ-SS7]MDU8941871.1 OsmC family protein [Rhodophyticola sp. MJ-SS7]